MSFINQGKTNWKFLIIIIILAVVVGGFLDYLWRTEKVEKENGSTNFKIAYYTNNALYVASDDGSLPNKVFDCYPGSQPGECKGINWLKDGRLLIQMNIDKLVYGAQDVWYDTKLLIFDLLKNTVVTVSHPDGYLASFAGYDPLIISAISDRENLSENLSQEYYLDPDTQEVSQINTQQVVLSSSEKLSYRLNDTLTYMDLSKTEEIPNTNGDLLVIDHSGLSKTSLYNVKSGFSKLLFDKGNLDFNGINYYIRGLSHCSLSEDSSFVACHILSSPPSVYDPDETSSIILIDTKSETKFFLTSDRYPELFSDGDIWSFQFSPDNQYLYIGFDKGKCKTNDIYRLKLSDKSLTKVLEGIQTNGNCAWVFALSPVLKGK